MDPAPFDTDLIRSFGRTREEAGEAYRRVYDQLRAVASATLRRGGSSTLHPTALVHEAWLKLRAHFENVRDRQHFLALAALAMRQILADRARAHRAAPREVKRLSVSIRLPEHSADDPAADQCLDLVALDDTLAKLTALKERHARVVELRFLCSLTIPETADVLGVSHATVESDWAMARAGGATSWRRAEGRQESRGRTLRLRRDLVPDGNAHLVLDTNAGAVLEHAHAREEPARRTLWTVSRESATSASPSCGGRMLACFRARA